SVSRAVIRNNNLKILIGLRQNAVKGASDKLLVVIRWKNYADARYLSMCAPPGRPGPASHCRHVRGIPFRSGPMSECGLLPGIRVGAPPPRRLWTGALWRVGGSPHALPRHVLYNGCFAPQLRGLSLELLGSVEEFGQLGNADGWTIRSNPYSRSRSPANASA